MAPESNFARVPRNRLYTYCAIYMAAVFLFDISIPLGIAGAVPYIVVILFSFWSPGKRLAIYLATVCTLLTIIGFFISSQEGEMWKAIFNRSLVLIALWVTAVLAFQWKSIEQRNIELRKNLDLEKEKIYVATIRGSQHIVNNLLNELQLVKIEAEKHDQFSNDVLSYFDSMVDEASTLMKKLSDIEDIDEDNISQSVHPDNHQQ